MDWLLRLAVFDEIHPTCKRLWPQHNFLTHSLYLCFLYYLASAGVWKAVCDLPSLCLVPPHQSLPLNGTFVKQIGQILHTEVCEKITSIDPRPNNYKVLCELFKSAAKNNIPCGYRKTFTPCWHPETEALLKQYETTGNPDTATQLLSSLDSVHHQTWTETLDSIDFTHSRRKVGNLLRHLAVACPLQHHSPQITANAVAPKLLPNPKGVTSK